MFKIDKPSEKDLAFFYENGYVAFPGVLTEEGSQGLMDEVLRNPQVSKFLQMTDEERSGLRKPHRISVVPWNDKGPFAQQLFDAPLISSLLRAVIGENYYFCHSWTRVAKPGAAGIEYHHDNHPLDPDEQKKWHIQMLYYPGGFKRGDTSLWVIPGSHRISDWGAYAPYGLAYPGQLLPHLATNPDAQGTYMPDDGSQPKITPELLTELYGEQVGRVFRAEELELPPHSMVFLNSRTYHSVLSKPADSGQDLRVLVDYVFKESESPYLDTQAIPPEWMNQWSSERRKLFQRDPVPIAYQIAKQNRP